MSERIPQPADDLETLDEQAALDAAKARQHIESLFRLLRGSDDAEPAAAAPGESHSVSQRFRVLRQHARGGLGEIWIAHDMELGREVALKEIRPRFAGRSDSWSRFQREATITGQLEHPGIVPIYALGHHENGQPFYAMRFVQGDTLADAIARFHRRDDAAPPPTERNLQLRKLITRLIDVCDAVAYAHSRNIIHRDLKPANIMLGEFGETLVVDWGLAKSLNEVTVETASATDKISTTDLGSRSTPTQMGSAVGSPPYMSPEQAGGRLDQLGPASDIYSLGATLFELLTGQAPIGAAAAGESRQKLSIKELLQHIQEGRFPRPTTVNPAVPRSLEAVCLKAMALRPEDRYRSARDLSADLESWLADEPVSAWTEPSQVRLRRWMRRHQTAVVSTLATVFVAVLGLSISLAIIAERNERLADGKTKLENSNRQLAKSNQELTESGQRESDARKLAERNANEAEANAREATKQKAKAIASRELADNNAGLAHEQSRLVLDMLGSVIFEFQNGLRSVAGEVRQRLLTIALRRLKSVADNFQARAFLDRHAVVAMMELGDLILQIGVAEANEAPDKVESEPLDVAQRLFEGAFDAAKRLSELDPSDTVAQQDFANVCTSLGNVNLRRAKLDVALSWFQQALEIRHRLSFQVPNGIEVRRDLALSCDGIGDVYRRLGEIEAALASYQRGLEVREKLLASDPSSALFQRDSSVSHERIGDTNLGIAKLDAALTAFQQCLKLRQRLAEASPNDAQAQQDMSFVLSKIADVSARKGDVNEAAQFYARALKIGERLVAATPNDVRARKQLSADYDSVGDLLRMAGHLEAARQSYLKNVEFREHQAELSLNDVDAQRAVAVSCDRLGDVEWKLQNYDTAMRYFEKALLVNKRLCEAAPNDVQGMRDLAVSYLKVGNGYLQLGDIGKARLSYQKDLEISERLETVSPGNAEAQRDVSVVLQKIGDCYLQEGDGESAMRWYQRSMDLMQRLAEASPNEVRARVDVMKAHAKIGMATRRAGQYQLSKNAFTYALKVGNQLREDQKLPAGDLHFIPELKNDLQFTSLVEQATGDWREIEKLSAVEQRALLTLRCAALPRFGRIAEAIDAADRFAALNPVEQYDLFNLACGYSQIAHALRQSDEQDAKLKDERSQKYIRLAISTLQKAIKVGFNNRNLMQGHSDLAPLRELPEFGELIPSKPTDKSSAKPADPSNK